MNKTIAACAVAAALSIGTSATAATIVFEPGNIVAGVNGIMVGGTTYDMTWTQGSFQNVGQNPPVLSAAADAELVAQTVIDLFNAENIAREQIKGLTCSTGDCDIVVAYNIDGGRFDAFNVDWGSTDWVLQPQNWSLTFENPIVAQASLTVSNSGAVPLPAGLPLLASALGIFAVARRRNKA